LFILFIGKVGINLIFNRDKELAVLIVAKITKFLYKLNIVKDFYMFYNKYIDKMIAYNRTYKINKSIIVSEVFSHVLILFLKSLFVYFIFLFVNQGTADLFFEILFCSVVLQVLMDLIPLPKGVLFFEIIFIILFKNIFFEGYLFWGLMLYRIFDYFIYVIHYLIIKMIELVLNSISKIKLKN